MQTLSFKIERDKIAQLDTLAEGRGGRGPFMRQLVDAVLRQAGAEVSNAPVPERESAAHRLYLRPTQMELAVIRHRAHERRMSPATWAMALVRRHLGIAAPVDHELREELLNCRQALQRIGINVNQIARAANKMALADNAAEIAEELHAVNELRGAIGAAVEGIGAATKGDLSYWEVPGERL
ncbi:plasmid mobilization relaxosome protein MobC [Novosphingobium sp. RD2P27]|uniref:Plasmid mobilization relaxosome protein MobC n=1 Tax=Novosphingobium kalidii TaxID=3230299 RepID=A0ABV2D5E4_9SPHN